MSILGWMIFGLIIEVVPKLLRGDSGGIILMIILGVVGALMGGFIGRALGWYGEEDLISSILAATGAMVVLFVYRQTADS